MAKSRMNATFSHPFVRSTNYSEECKNQSRDYIDLKTENNKHSYTPHLSRKGYTLVPTSSRPYIYDLNDFGEQGIGFQISARRPAGRNNKMISWYREERNMVAATLLPL
jgi:hypothetical protein